MTKERAPKNKGKEKQRGSENRDDSSNDTEHEISDDSDKMDVDDEDKRRDLEKTTKVCLSWRVVTLLSIAT